jgi:uncharacterized membrane protein (DUF106 family)
MALLDIFKNVVSDGASKLVTSIGDAFAKNFTTDEERLQQQKEMVKQVQDYQTRMTELANEMDRSYLADVANARSMQMAALAQDDKFSKRFVYYLAIGICLLAFVFDFLLFFVKYPDTNRDMLNMVAGVINSGALISIISFFFGSSQSSVDKQKQLNKMSDESAKQQ